MANSGRSTSVTQSSLGNENVVLTEMACVEKCCYCGSEVAKGEPRCSHCGRTEPTGTPFYKSPALVAVLLVCWGIPFAFLHVLTKLPDLLSALIAIPAGIALFVILRRTHFMRKIGSIILWTVFALSVGLFMAGFFAIRVAHIIPQAGLIYGMLAVHWLATVAACVLTLLLSTSTIQRRVWFSFGLSLLAVNGRSQCLFDSRWFFTASLLLATFALVFTLWKRWRLREVNATGSPETVG